MKMSDLGQFEAGAEDGDNTDQEETTELNSLEQKATSST